MDMNGIETLKIMYVSPIEHTDLRTPHVNNAACEHKRFCEKRFNKLLH